MGANFVRCMGWLIGACVLVSVAQADIAPPLPKPACDRVCLDDFVDQFLKAAIAHDPSELATTANVKYTEDGQKLPLGAGLWATMSGVGDYKLYVPDPSVQEVGYLGSIEENGAASLLALRLKVDGNKVSQIEAIVARPARGGPDPYAKVGPVAPVFLQSVDEAYRLPRYKMISIANSYFDAIEKNSGEMAPFTDDCVRIENGVVTAGDPDAKNIDHLKFNLTALNCRQQLDTKVMQYITSVSPRRFVAVDEEHGLVFTLPMFVYDGKMPKMETLADGETMPTPSFALHPSTQVGAEVFKIVDGKIAAIESVGTLVPYGSKHGWETH
jgi:hypothetical protein